MRDDSAASNDEPVQRRRFALRHPRHPTGGRVGGDENEIAAPAGPGGRLVSLNRVLRRRSLLMLTVATLSAAFVLIGLNTREPVFRSEAAVTVAPPPPAAPDYAYIPAFETARTARDVFQSPPVAAEVARRVGEGVTGEQVRSRTTAIANADWQTLSLRYEGPTREDAEALARESLAVALPTALAALPESSQLAQAGAPTPASEVPRPLSLMVVMIVGVAIASALLVAVLSEIIVTRFGRDRPAVGFAITPPRQHQAGAAGPAPAPARSGLVLAGGLDAGLPAAAALRAAGVAVVTVSDGSSDADALADAEGWRWVARPAGTGYAVTDRATGAVRECARLEDVAAWRD